MNIDLTDSVVDSYSVSKRLSFDFNSSQSPVVRRRRNPDDDDDVSTLKRRRDDMSSTTTTGTDYCDETFASSSTAVAGMSPWESRRLKVDLIEARARISHMMRELEQQHQIKATTEAMLQDKVDQLTKQVDHTTKKAADLEKHVQVLRKRESTAKEDLLRATGALKKVRQQHDDQVNDLRRTNQNLEETLQCMTNDLRNEISNLSRDLESALGELSTTQDELKATKSVNVSFQERLGRMSELEKELEEERQAHQAAQLRLKDLQFQLDSYGEWQEVSKKTIGRLSGMGDLDKEVVRLRAELKSMREMVGNKLLLEEQVFDLRARLDRQEQVNVDAVQLQVKVEQLQREVNEWKGVAVDHCPNGSAPNPITLRTRLEEVLKTNLVMSSEKHSDKSQRNSISGEVQELKSQTESYARAINDLKTALKHNQTLLHRVQKKLMLVAKERDCYKQVIEHYEKEMTITGSNSLSNPDSQARIRLDMLEKSLSGYKELCATLESDLATAKGSAAENTATIPVSGLNSEQYERLRRDLDEARLDNERLRRRKEELELKYEQLAIKTSSLEGKRERTKVVHFQNNPADVAYESHKQYVAKLQAEIERLRRTIQKMENDQEEMTARFNETGLTCNIQEQTELRKQMQSLEAKNKHMKELFTKASQEFREIVYMLFGYRVDRVGNSNYRLFSMYAENEEEYLSFRLNESSQLDLLETNYSATLTDQLRLLEAHHSLPVFLSSLTMELFNRVTVTITS